MFNPAVHFTAIAATAFTFNAQGAINLGHMGVSNVVVTGNPAGTTYVAGTDYTLDAVNGAVTIVPSGSGGHITAGASVLIAFNYADPSKVAAADIIGAVTGGVYTGMQACQTTYGTMGFFPKILIAPGYSQDAGDGRPRRDGQHDARDGAGGFAAGDTGGDAISNRGTGQLVRNPVRPDNPVRSAGDFLRHGIVPNSITIRRPGRRCRTCSTRNDGPYSPWVAGAMAAKDLAQGYWWSSSNTQLMGCWGRTLKCMRRSSMRLPTPII